MTIAARRAPDETDLREALAEFARLTEVPADA